MRDRIKLIVVKRLHWINVKKIKLNQKLPSDYTELIKKDQTE